MPRFTNFQLGTQNSCHFKRRIIPSTSRCGHKRRNGPALKTFSASADYRCKKFVKPSRLLKTYRPQDVFNYPLLLNDDRMSPASIFGFTQKRHCCWAKQGDEKMWDSGPRIVIVGAGIAGISAAAHLAENGFNNFHIYEASARLGGRINTAKFSNGGTCELGGEWLAGGDISNGLIILANQEGLFTDPDWRYNRQIVCLTSEGKALCSELCSIGRKIFNAVRKEAYRLFKAASDIKHGTLLYFIDRRLSEELRIFKGCVLESLQRLMLAFKNDMRVSWGAELNKMSSDLLGSYADEPGNAVRLRGGLVNALLPLVKKIPANKIHLNSPIKTIFWDEGKTSIVLDNSQEIPADYIIVTVPLGYLKKNYENFFHPKLPKDKIEAIDRMGYGKVTKIFMKYPFELWGHRRTEISTLWKTRDWSDRQTYWYKGISCVHVQRDMAAVNVGGPEAIYVEEEQLDTLAQDITALLRCFTNSSFLPVPKELLISKWNSDPLHNGSGSYLSLNSCVVDPVILGKPLMMCERPKILFAGEATCPDRLNTIQGARSTGIREAQRIINSITSAEKSNAEECCNAAQ